MMSFLHPEFLYYMTPVVIVLFILLLTQKGSQESFFSEDVLSRLRVSANTLTLKARNALFMVIALLLTLALAGPVIEEGSVEVKAKSADIMLALDISDSMLAQDIYPNRLEFAKRKALTFLKIAKEDRIGVVAFAKNAYLVSPLSFDHGAVAFLLSKLSTHSITEKGTAILSMLQEVDEVMAKDAKRYILILSDGSDKEDFSEEIAYAKEKKITIYVLGVATQKGAPIRYENGDFAKQNGEIILTKLNESIAELATQTGGIYIQSVKSQKDIKMMLKEIELHATKHQLKSQMIQRYIPLFYYPLGLALILLLIATSSMSKREVVVLPSGFLIFTLLGGAWSDADAGVLDFVMLQDAKTAYEKGDYNEAAKRYVEYANATKNAESFYNGANALYKQKRYDEAIALYKKAKFAQKTKRAQNFANLGNAYAQKQDQASLQKALESYERSLKLQEDQDVRQNLEIVKELLKKQKKKDKQEQQDKNKKKKDQQEKQDQNKKKQDQQNNQDQNKKKKDQQKDQDQNKKKQDQQQNQGKKDSQNNQDQNQKKREQSQKKQEPKQPSQPNFKKEKMSDLEEQKWIKALNKAQNSYLYKLNKSDKIQKENTYEKPW